MGRTTSKKRKALIVGGIALVAVAAGAVVVGVAANNAGEFDQSLSENCAPLVALAFRGSGEGNLTPGVEANAGEPYRYGTSELETNGWEGVTLQGLFDELSVTTYNGFSADSIPVLPIGPAGESEPFGYDAIDAVTEASSIDSAITFSSSRLLHSAQRGAEAATHIIQSYLQASEGCAVLPKFVIVGYSQGAMAARHTAELNADSVLGVVTIGDPYQKPEGLGVRAGGINGTGIIRWKADDDQKSQLDGYYDFEEFKSSICHAGDPICEFEPLGGLWKLATGTYGDHLDYYTSAYPGEAPEDAEVIARLGYEQWQRALAAAEAGARVSAADADDAVTASIRTVSLAYAGTPTLFSAWTAGNWGRDLIFEFDLDGDGVFESPSPSGTIWATFPDEGPRTVGVRVTDAATGTSDESSTTVQVAPQSEGEIRFDPATSATVTTAGSVVRGERLPVSVAGGSPTGAALYPAGWSAPPVILDTPPGVWSAGLPIPATLPAGRYDLVISLESGGWATAQLDVLDSVPPVTTSPPAPTVTPPAVIATTPPLAPAPPETPVVPPGPQPEPEPAIVLSDVSVLAGERLGISGRDLPPSAPVRLTIDSWGVDLLVETSLEGTFEAGVDVPSDAAPREHVLRVSWDESQPDLQVTFTVTAPEAADPTLELSPAVVSPGAATTVSGTGFPPGSAVTLRIDQLDIVRVVETTLDGELTAFLDIDYSAMPGEYVLIATVGSTTVQTTLTVLPAAT